MKDIKEIQKRKTLGIFNNSIEVKAYDEVKKKMVSLIFTSFASRNIAYNRIKMVWKAYLRANNLISSKKRNSLENEVGGVNAQNHSQNKNIDKSILANFISDSESNSSEDHQNDNLNLTNSNFNRSTNLSEYNQSVDNDATCISSSKEEIYFPPLDTEKVFECCKIDIKIPIVEIYEKFLKDGAEFSWDKFYEDVVGNTNVSITEWKEIEPNLWIRDLNFLIKVKDVPFVTQTRVHKAQKLRKEGDKYTISGSSTSLDIPYSSYFHIEDTWEFISNGDRCVLRTTALVNFTKSTMFKSKIEKKTREEFKKEVDKWCEYITSKNIIYENYNASGRKKSTKDEEVLSHGLEKSETKFMEDPVKKISLRYFISVCLRVKNYIYGIFSSNPREFINTLLLSFICVMLVVVMTHIFSINQKITFHNQQLEELKNIILLNHSINASIISNNINLDKIKFDF